MKKILIVSIFALLAGNVKSQTKAEVVGKWLFNDVYLEANDQPLDSTGMKLMKAMFGDASFTFNEDGSFVFYAMGKKEEGKWSYDEKTKTIAATTTKKGTTNKIKIMEYNPSRMAILVGNSVKLWVSK